jgi:hypothetical protein
MTTIPCRERTFELSLSAEVPYHAWRYLSWLKHVLERLGRQAALDLWVDALDDYDDLLLLDILSTGWEEFEADETPCTEGQLRDVAVELFNTPVEGMIPGQVRAILENTPPFAHIRRRFPNLNVRRQVTTYDALHLFHDSLALLVEKLIERYGKQGELIAYDALLEQCSPSAAPRMSVEEYLSQRAARFRSSPGKPDMFTAGLEVELVRASDTEVVTLVTECEWARYYQERHPSVGYLLACSLDNAAYRSINGRLRLQRTSTLMEGGDACDFRVYAVAAAAEHESGDEGD